MPERRDPAKHFHNLPFGVDDKRLTQDTLTAIYLFTPRTIRADHLTRRVAQQRKVEGVLGFKRLVSLGRVHRYADNLRTHGHQFVSDITEAARLDRAARRVILRIKIKYDPFTRIVCQAVHPAGFVSKRKICSFLRHVCHYTPVIFRRGIINTRMHTPTQTNTRIQALDLLRGFFIFVIIVDHMQRWPSPLTYITGEGRLWVSAAEGFFIISGLLIGYIRGRRHQAKPIREITTGLFNRAWILYAWSVVITLLAVGLVKTFAADTALLPTLPSSTGPAFAWHVISQQYVFDWIYFLRLYWIMLLAAPLAILLLRKSYGWLVLILSLGLYASTLLTNLSEPSLQWQALFFTAATIGYYLEPIRDWLYRHSVLRRITGFALVTATLATMLLSYFWVLGWSYIESGDAPIDRDTYIAVRTHVDPYFTKEPLAPLRIILAFVWFGGLFVAFHYLRRPLKKTLGWLLLPFGRYSLTAYCLQALLLIGVQVGIPAITHPLLNLGISVGGVLLIWLLIQLPLSRKILPQ